MRYASEKENLKKLLASTDNAYYNVDNETYEMIEEGRAEGIQALVETCKELGLSKKDAKKKLEQKNSLSPEKVEEYMEKYW